MVLQGLERQHRSHHLPSIDDLASNTASAWGIITRRFPARHTFAGMNNKWLKGLQLTIGVNNFTNTVPPLIPSEAISRTTSKRLRSDRPVRYTQAKFNSKSASRLWNVFFRPGSQEPGLFFLPGQPARLNWPAGCCSVRRAATLAFGPRQPRKHAPATNHALVRFPPVTLGVAVAGGPAGGRHPAVAASGCRSRRSSARTPSRQVRASRRMATRSMIARTGALQRAVLDTATGKLSVVVRQRREHPESVLEGRRSPDVLLRD